MPIWLPTSSEEEPDVTLTSWAVFEVLIPRIGKPTSHVVGYCLYSREGRVSSPLKKVDSARRMLVSSSGRGYRLDGPPGLHAEAEYVWHRWQSAWDVTLTRDLTAEMMRQLQHIDGS